MEEYQGVRKSLWDLVEGQKRNTAQLERIRRTEMMQRSLRIAPERVRRGRLHRLPPVSVLVLFSFSIDFISSVN